MIKEKKVWTGRSIFKFFLLFFFVLAILLSVVYSLQGESLSTIRWEQINPVEIVKALRVDFLEKKDQSLLMGDFNPDFSELYQGNLLLLSESDLRLINPKGEEVWYLPHEIYKPVLRVQDDLILLYEQSGKSFVVVRDGKILLEDILEEEIAFAEITDKYILFISRNNIGYKRVIHMLDPENGMKLGALYIDDYYPYYLQPGAIGDQSFLLYGLGLGTTKLTTVIREYGINLSPNPITGIELEGLFPVLLENAERMVFVGENSSICYNKDFDILWSKNFDSDIAAAAMFDDGGTVFALKGYETVLLFMDDSGKEINRIPFKDTVRDIETYEGTAAVTIGSEVLFYGRTGDLTGQAIMPGLNVKVHFTGSKKAYLISEHEVIYHHISSKTRR